MRGVTGFSGQGLLCIRGGRPVFAKLDFRIGAGDALVLGGPNGSGKSSLLRLMAGLLPPALGRLERDGSDVGDDPDNHRRRVAFIAHADACKPALTARENLAFWARLRGTENRVGAGLEAFGLSALGEMPARLLSAGQRRRLALARLVAAPADLWLLDEPTTALDRASVAAMEALIRAHRDSGGMVVLSTHVALDIGPAHHIDLARFAPAVDVPDGVDA